jgi:hypothetical protein
MKILITRYFKDSNYEKPFRLLQMECVVDLNTVP